MSVYPVRFNSAKTSHKLVLNSKESELKVPICFVHPGYQKWNMLADLGDIEDCYEKLNLINGGRDCWLYQTFVHLKRRGLNVFFSDAPLKTAINILHYDDLNYNLPYDECFIVSIKADRDRSFLCECEIIQSPFSKEGQHCFFVPLWPQPGLIPRNTQRKNTVKNLCYFGAPENVSGILKTDHLKKELDGLGVNLEFKQNSTDWLDYSCVDIVLAIRDGGKYFLSSKPASKLINGWIAGCPVIVGNEPIFNIYKKSELDFFKAVSPEEIVAIVKKLLNEPELYNAMILNGLNRAKECSENNVSMNWIHTLESGIEPLYEQWRKKSSLRKFLEWHIKFIRKLVRGALYDQGFDNDGNPLDKTTFARKLIWLLFDRFAWETYKQKYD